MSSGVSTLFVAEPSRSLYVRPPLVADCSALAAVLFQEAERDEALARLSGHELHAPQLLDIELASVALKKARSGDAEVAQAGLELYGQAALTLHRVDPIAVVELAQKCRLSACDAAYLWLAAELKVPLLTFDRALGTAAAAYLGALR